LAAEVLGILRVAASYEVPSRATRAKMVGAVHRSTWSSRIFCRAWNFGRGPAAAFEKLAAWEPLSCTEVW